MSRCEFLHCERVSTPLLASNSSSSELHLAPRLLECAADLLLPSKQLLHAACLRRPFSRWAPYCWSRGPHAEVQVLPWHSMRARKELGRAS